MEEVKTNKLPTYVYSQEAMLEIALKVQEAGIRSPQISTAYNNDMGLFDPDLWIGAIWAGEDTTSGGGGTVITGKKSAVDRLKTEAAVDGDIVLSPQRRSFGQGCRREVTTRPESPQKRNAAGQNEATTEFLNHLGLGVGEPGGGRKGPTPTFKNQTHPSAVIGAARANRGAGNGGGGGGREMGGGREVGTAGPFNPPFAPDCAPPEPFSKHREDSGLSWREQMQGPMAAWRKRGGSGSDPSGGRRYEPNNGRHRGNSGGGASYWNSGPHRCEALPEWMDENADETMELGGFDEHEARKACEKEAAATRAQQKPIKPTPNNKAPSPFRGNGPTAPAPVPQDPLERESDFADMFGLTPTQLDTGVDLLFPFMSASSNSFLTGSNVSVPGQAERVSELKAAGQSRFSRFFGSSPFEEGGNSKPTETRSENPGKSGTELDEQRELAKRRVEAESQSIMAKLLKGGHQASALQDLLSNVGGSSLGPPMPPPSSQQPMSLAEIEAKLKEQNCLNGQRPLEGQPGRGLFGRSKEDEPNQAAPGAPPKPPNELATKGDPLSNPVGQAQLLQSLSKLSMETDQAENSAQQQANALQRLLQQSQCPPQQTQPMPSQPQQHHQPPFPQQQFPHPPAQVSAGRLPGLHHQVPPTAPHPMAQMQGPPRPQPQPTPGFPAAAIEAQHVAAANILKAMAAKSQAGAGPQAEQQSQLLLAHLMAQARQARPQQPTGPVPPQMMQQGPPRPHNVHMAPFVGSSGAGGPQGPNGTIPPPELYNLLAAQMRSGGQQPHQHQHQHPMQAPQPPLQAKPPSAYGPGFMPLSVLKQAANQRAPDPSVDQHLTAHAKSGSDGNSDEDDNYGAKRLSVASGVHGGQHPYHPHQHHPTAHHGPNSAAPPNNASMQQYLAMLQANSRMGRGQSGNMVGGPMNGGGGGGGAQMERAQHLALLQTAASRGDPAAIHALQALQHQAIAASHHHNHNHRSGNEGGGNDALARLFGAGSQGQPPPGRPLTMEELDRAAASQPFL